MEYQEFITEKGNKLYWAICYQPGGPIPNTWLTITRRYELYVCRNLEEHGGGDLSAATGSILVNLNKVTRRSKKREQLAHEIAIKRLPDIAKYYGL